MSRRTLQSSLRICALLGLVSAANAQLTQQGSKLVGTPTTGSTILQGVSVALSADGTTAAVGGDGDNQTGAVWIWTQSGGVWSQQARLVGTGASSLSPKQGLSVALSADGSTLAVGGDGDGASQGAVWVFSRDVLGNWTQQGSKLTASGGSNTGLGHSVAITADGNTILAGGPFDSGQSGGAWVYTRTAGVWTQLTKLLGTGVIGLSSEQGLSVAISQDGHQALLGGPIDNSNVGAVWVFRQNGGGWFQEAKLVGDGYSGALSPQQGYAVALSQDGSTALAGGHDDNLKAGAAWVFTRDGSGNWTQQGSKLVGNDATGKAGQGSSVALSGDGNSAAIGGPNDNTVVSLRPTSTGAFWLFQRSAGVWSQSGAKIVGTGGDANSQQGFAVAISNDGFTLMEGGPQDASSKGAAWPFGFPGPTAPPVMTKAFSPSTIPAGALTTLTFTIANPTIGTLNGVGFTDTPLPSGQTLASSPNVSDANCGSPTITANSSDVNITVSGASVLAGTPCTISMAVQGTATSTNTTSAVSSSAGAGAAASATLTVTPTTNVSSHVKITSTGFLRSLTTGLYTGTVILKNTGSSGIPLPLSVAFSGLPAGVTLSNPTGTIFGSPYLHLAPAGTLAAGQAITFVASFISTGNAIHFTAISYSGL